jgi:hypothetical protein
LWWLSGSTACTTLAIAACACTTAAEAGQWPELLSNEADLVVYNFFFAAEVTVVLVVAAAAAGVPAAF